MCPLGEQTGARLSKTSSHVRRYHEPTQSMLPAVAILVLLVALVAIDGARTGDN